MSDPQQILTPEQVAEAGLTGWQQQGEEIRVRYATGSFATGLALVNTVGLLAEEVNHHPDVTLTYPEVGVTLSSHDVGGITSRDLDLARKISRVARADGIPIAD